MHARAQEHMQTVTTTYKHYLRLTVKINISPQATSKFTDVDSIIGLGINISKGLESEADCILGTGKAHIAQNWGDYLWILIISVQAEKKNVQI
jgi:hypothetical protein